MMSEREGKRRGWLNWVGVVILVAAYAMAISRMARVRQEEFSGDRIVLRLVHWQLESGVRDAIDEMIRRFETQYRKETGRELKIIHNPISERVYRQYVQTQFISGTAPDLIEIGMFDTRQYLRRYFLPNTEDVRRPNPYNRGTPLEKTPWADTYVDGMMGSLDQETYVSAHGVFSSGVPRL
jgi:hypothetical protein